MARISKKKKLTAIGAAAVLLASAGAAFAFWTSTGSGSDDAMTGTSATWSVDVEAPAGPALAPTTASGTPVQNWTYTVTNNSDGVMDFDSIAYTITTDKLGDGCDASWYVISNDNPATGPVNPGAANAVNGSFDLRLIESNTNQDACQGAKVTVTAAIVNAP